MRCVLLVTQRYKHRVNHPRPRHLYLTPVIIVSLTQSRALADIPALPLSRLIARQIGNRRDAPTPRRDGSKLIPSTADTTHGPLFNHSPAPPAWPKASATVNNTSSHSFPARVSKPAFHHSAPSVYHTHTPSRHIPDDCLVGRQGGPLMTRRCSPYD